MVVYDLECINSPVPLSEAGIKKYIYSNGWDDYVGMGISVCAWYDYRTDTIDFFTEYDLENKTESVIRFSDIIQSGELISGFNINKYDNNMLRAHGIKINDNQCYDIYAQWLNALGLDPNNWDYKTHGGYKLDAMLSANGLENKNGDGADAPFMWQEGKHKEVIDYCKHDVKVETSLLNCIFEYGGLISPKTGKLVRMMIPSM